MDSTPLLDLVLASAQTVDATSDRILDAALSCFLNVGIRRTSMNEIARSARLGVATVYRRYPQRDELVQAVIYREAGRFVAAVDQKVQGITEVETMTGECFVGFVVGLKAHPLLRRLLVTEPEVTLPWLTIDANPIIALGRAYLATLIGRLQAAGSIPEYDPNPVAELIARIAHSMFLTPDTVIPHADDERTRTFAREHIAPLLTLGVRL